MAKTKNAPPVHEVRLGRVKATVWANETENGTRHSVTISRIYKNGDDNWAETQSFGRDDLPLVEKVADLACRWIYESSQVKAAEEQAA